MPARLKGGRVQQPPATSGQSLSSLPPKTGAADRTQSPHSRPTTTQASPCENALAAHRVPQIQYPVSRPSVSPAPRGDLSEGVESRLEPFAGACWLAAPTPIAASLPTQRLCGAGLVSLDFSRPSPSSAAALAFPCRRAAGNYTLQPRAQRAFPSRYAFCKSTCAQRAFMTA